MLATDFTCVSGGDENAPLLNRTQSPDTTNPTLGLLSGGDYPGHTYHAIAGRAQCLLLFGGGGFELVTLYEYLRSHPIPSKQCWKFLYTRKNFKGQYLELMAKYSGIKIDDVGVSAYLQHLLHE